MATTTVTVAAPPSAVYATLLDAWTYEVWVGGTKRIRAVDDDWPAPGSRFHHSAGIGPVATRDETRMVRAVPDRLVELEVHLWPIGQARVRLELTERGGGTQVTMTEQFRRGPGALAGPAQQVLITLRNRYSLDKLARIVEQRHRMQQGAAVT